MLLRINLPRRPAVAITLVLLALLALLALPTAEPADAVPAYSTSDVTFGNDGAIFHGRVLVPTGPAAHRPAVVIVAGSGPREMDDYRREAEAFVAAGIVTLIYDKRTAGYSLTERSYRQLGDDALAGLELLRGRLDVDPDRVGLWGHSEGGWVVPLAASRSKDVAFVIVAGASALSPARTQTWSTCRYLIQSGFSERACGALSMNLIRVMIAAGVFPEAEYDPLPALRSLDIPMLAIFAEHDQSTAPAESRALMQSALKGNSNPHTSFPVIARTDHNFLASDDGFATNGESGAGYLETLGAWVAGLDSDPVKPSSEPTPAQAGATEPVRALTWLESLPLQGFILAMLLLGFATYPLGALMGRLRRWPIDRRTAAPSRVLVSCGAASVLGTLCFLGYVISTGAADSLGPAALERPLAWLGLQLLAIATIAASAWLGVVSWRARGTLGRAPKVRAGALLAVGAVFIPWALYWGLLTP